MIAEKRRKIKIFRASPMNPSAYISTRYLTPLLNSHAVDAKRGKKLYEI
jgi:hypothetical protein